MEVLISIFVMAVGLLGIAAMIPLGRYTLVETGKADRAGACGRAALREIRVRRMLDPRQWVYGSSWYPTMANQPAVCIDPLFVAATSNTRFPASTLSPTYYMYRLSLGQYPQSSGATAAKLPLDLARQIFVWRDDQLFDLPDDRDLRSQQMFLYSNGTVNTATSATNLVLREAVENYSWMVTAVPDLVDSYGVSSPASAAYVRRMYTVSVVVFYKRSLTLAYPFSDTQKRWSERICNVQFIGTGLGGGDVRLWVTASTDVSRDAEYLDVKRNDWIMLCGRNPTGSPTAGAMNVFRWYKVVGASENVTQDTANNRTVRYVVLSGPDWDSLTTNVQAVILPGVVGVYSRGMELDLSPARSQMRAQSF